MTYFRRRFVRKTRPIHFSFFSFFVGLIFDNRGPIYQYGDIKTEICNCSTSVHSWQPVNNLVMQISIFVLIVLPANFLQFRYAQPADGLTYSKKHTEVWLQVVKCYVRRLIIAACEYYICIKTVKVKIHFTLGQTTKAQSWSWRIAVLIFF